VVPNVGGDLFGFAKESPSLTGRNLLFTIEERSLESHADVFGVSSRLLSIAGKNVQVSSNVLRLQRNRRHPADGMPTVAQFTGASQSLFAMAADPNRNAGLLHRLGQKNDVGKITVLAVEGRVLFSPELSEGLDIFICNPAPLVERRRFQVIELFFHPAYTQAHDYPALRKNIETREHLGRDDRIPIGRDHDASDEADALRGSGEERHRRQGFQVIARAVILAVDGVRIGNRYILGNDDVIGDGNAVKAQ